MKKTISKNIRNKLKTILVPFLEKEQYIFYSQKIIKPTDLKSLINLGLIVKIKAGVYLIKNPNEEDNLAIQKNLPAIIKFLGEEYKNWCLGGTTALEYYLYGQTFQEKIRILIKNEINKNLKIGNYIFEFRGNKNLSKEMINILPVDKIPLNLLSPEHLSINLLYRLPLNELPKIKEAIPSLFRDYHFDLEKLNQYAKKEKKIKALKTFNNLLSKIPKKINANPIWITQYNKEYKKYVSDIKEIRTNHLKPNSNLQTLIDDAIKNKKYDAYHSTTVEGYDITPEEVSKLLDGKLDMPREKRLTDFLAIKGYVMAFDFLIKKIKNDFGHPKINKKLIKDIQTYLWTPNVNYGILEKKNLGLYRHEPVYIRNSFYVPPNWIKVPDLMNAYIKSINKIKNKIYYSVISHSDLVKIHPFIDGNGRTARFLMNYVLLCSGYKWVTIRNDCRDKYFKTLEQAQIKGEIIPFAKFIINLIEQNK
jgi:hypothetical protein